MPRQEPQQPSGISRLAQTVGYAIVAVFVVGQVIEFCGGHKLAAEVYVLLGIVAGGLFGVSAIKRR